MTRLAWGNAGEKFFETGIDLGVFYPKGGEPGVPWNGLTAVKEAPTGGDSTPIYLDGTKILNESSAEEFEATIEAYTYPDVFAEYDGTAIDDGLAYDQQERKEFDLAYRTKIGNDVDGTDHAYKIHLIYNALASPSQTSYGTLTDSADPNVFSWSITTRAVPVPGFKPVSHLVIDSTRLEAKTLAIIEDYLYGAELVDARMLFPVDLKEILPWLYFEIVPNYTTGINSLVVSEKLDVRGDPLVGIYKRTPRSRLVESSTPGFYTLDV